jgi:ABC-2 type transport system permease protein
MFFFRSPAQVCVINFYIKGGFLMGSIIRKELKLLLKGKGNLFFLLIMPLLFIVLFGAVFSNINNATLTINYIDQDQSAISRHFIDSLSKVSGFSVKADATNSPTRSIQQIKNGKLNSLLVIPKGFDASVTSAGKPPVVLPFYTDPTHSTENGPIESMLESVASRYQQKHLSAALKANGKSATQIAQLLQSPIQIQPTTEVGNRQSSGSALDTVVPGYTVMFVFFIIMNMVRSFLGEKESGMLARLQSTPMSPLSYLLGMWIPAIIAVLIQCTVLLSFGHIVYGLALGNIGLIAAIVLCLSICGTGIGLAISLMARGENQGRSISMLISLGGAALGGVWVPIDLMPKTLQTIGHLSPQYWAQQGFQDVMVHGSHFMGIWQPLAVLLAWGFAGLLVALLRFPRFFRSAVH